MKNSFTPLADDVFRLYPIPTAADAREALIRATTVLEVIAPARWAAAAMQGMKSKAYLYNVTWSIPTSGGRQMGAFHGIDVFLLFNSPQLPQDEAGGALAEATRLYWVQFARTGNPNAPGLPNWPAYDSTGAYLELGSQIKPASGSHEDAFQIVNRLYATRLDAIKRMQ